MSQLELDDWDELDRKGNWPVLLTGNGASRAVSDMFCYESLLQAAVLETPDLALFDTAATKNFEEVLRGLEFAAVVHEQLTGDATPVQERAKRVREALIEAVNRHHIEWSRVPPRVFTTIREVLTNHEAVFTTNYDLLLYWAINHDSTEPFTDWFVDGGFDPDVEWLPGDRTEVIWLHGGLQLHRAGSDRTEKAVNLGPGGDLRRQFADGGRLPLYVAEGSSDQKRRTIRSSDYLSWAYDRFANETRDLVIFGHALGPSDGHLVDALKAHRGRIACSVLPTSTRQVAADRATLAQRLERDDIVFFDSTTHPLGRIGT